MNELQFVPIYKGHAGIPAVERKHVGKRKVMIDFSGIENYVLAAVIVYDNLLVQRSTERRDNYLRVRGLPKRKWRYSG